jgi:hypothetical protein
VAECRRIIGVDTNGTGTEQEIPKAQRQGAIIILGMLALAKREVVTERVDSLLKIGLGNLGMVSLGRTRSDTCQRKLRTGVRRDRDLGANTPVVERS